jgi:hypothetical protein
MFKGIVQARAVLLIIDFVDVTWFVIVTDVSIVGGWQIRTVVGRQESSAWTPRAVKLVYRDVVHKTICDIGVVVQRQSLDSSELCP